MDPQAHHIVQRELSQHGCARGSLVRAAPAFDVRDRELDGRKVNCARVTAIAPRTRQVPDIEDGLVIGSGAVASRVHERPRVLAARLEGTAPPC
jgi:hypothetical protein